MDAPPSSAAVAAPPTFVRPQGARLVLALLALALGGFGIGTTEFATMGVLPQISDDLRTSIPSTGHLISLYALGVVVGAPLLAVLGARLPRKQLLLALMLVVRRGERGLGDGAVVRPARGRPLLLRTPARRLLRHRFRRRRPTGRARAPRPGRRDDDGGADHREPRRCAALDRARPGLRLAGHLRRGHRHRRAHPARADALAADRAGRPRRRDAERAAAASGSGRSGSPC